MKTIMSILTICLLLISCSDKTKEVKTKKWFTQSQVKLGENIYQKNCIACHQKDAVGTLNWKTRIEDGTFPPPPLNGDAHTWHHSLNHLKDTIRNGGARFGGKMPPFKNTLSEEEIESVIAYFQSKWDEKIYRVWLKRISGIKLKE